MKKYYRFTRRRTESARFIAIGSVIAALGVLAYFYLTGGAIWCGVLVPCGVLLAALPQFVIRARYGVKGDTLYYTKKGLPHKTPVSEAAAALICVHDEYRGMRGYVPALSDRNYSEGAVPLPAILFLRGVKTDELDLCDTRTNTRLTHRGAVLADMLLDFSFLEELWKDEAFAGEVYVSEYIYAMYRPAFDELFQGSGRVHVYDRIPKAFKEARKAAK